MNEVMIKIENLGKKFGELWAVRDLNLEVRKSEIFAFLGPNGAGKTTTLKLITGLLRPTTGRIEIAGYDIQTQPLQVKKLLAYIPDEPYLYEKLTGREFLNFVAELYAVPKSEREDKIQEFIEYFEMSSYIDDLIQGYSHGMKQRLIFSSAFIHNPQILVIDEPLVGLDPASARKVKHLLREKAIQGLTVFVSTHTLSFAEEIAHRIGIIDNGNLVAVGDLNELKAKSGVEGKLEEVFLKITQE
ncbi:MAG: ABC transporter ATP-binding protein [Candidatus Omnitrophica bacterium]|nr:ABC transporter ATP-binding protein [Candidatus Omnitrophota bacterium]